MTSTNIQINQEDMIQKEPPLKRYMVVLFTIDDDADIIVNAHDEQEAVMAALEHKPGYFLLTALPISSMLN